jgi:hypothetical protein
MYCKNLRSSVRNPDEITFKKNSRTKEGGESSVYKVEL